MGLGCNCGFSKLPLPRCPSIPRCVGSFNKTTIFIWCSQPWAYPAFFSCCCCTSKGSGKELAARRRLFDHQYHHKQLVVSHVSMHNPECVKWGLPPNFTFMTLSKRPFHHWHLLEPASLLIVTEPDRWCSLMDYREISKQLGDNNMNNNIKRGLEMGKW